MFGPDDHLPEGRMSRFRRTTSELQPGWQWKAIPLAVAVFALTVWYATRPASVPSEDDGTQLVLYCSHDLPFVEPLIAEFEQTHGVEVTLVADTEANKSLGLTRRIEAERRRPQADVFWNNQLLGTMALAEKGVFASHADIAERARFPESCRDAQGHWTAFGARFRVWIMSDGADVATDSVMPGDVMPTDPNFCLADPLFGTTLTHAAVLWQTQGGDVFRAWYASLPRKGVRVVPGNSATRDLVADGVCKLGWTDTDDYFGAVDRGAAVSSEPVRINGRAIAIPNSVAILKNAPHPKAARTFVAWLLSENVERRLAAGPAAQVPLGTLTGDEPLPERVESLRQLTGETLDLRPFVAARAEVLKYLSGATP